MRYTFKEIQHHGLVITDNILYVCSGGRGSVGGGGAVVNLLYVMATSRNFSFSNITSVIYLCVHDPRHVLEELCHRDKKNILGVFTNN